VASISRTPCKAYDVSSVSLGVLDQTVGHTPDGVVLRRQIAPHRAP
jgi:hypothetical protein